MPSFLERLLLLPSALLVLSAAQAYSAVLSARQSSTTLPAPIVIPPNQNWDGYDGSWSSFTLGVGTPQQYVRTFVSFASYQTWVVLPQGCDATQDKTACASQRGWLFNELASSTWNPIGIYDLSIEQNLGSHGNADYGYDTVELGGVGQSGPIVKNSTVGGMAVETYYLGVFGVNPRPTNWTSFDEGSPSYMTLLKDQKSIPSISVGFNAGAKYRDNGVLASLTLGGYDESKYIPNDATFTFGADNSRDIVVAIQSISTDLQNSGGAQQLLNSPVYADVDSTVPQIWLPLAACQAFETVFGIQFDNATGLYLVNNSLHNTLTQQNPNVTFTLAQGFSGGSTVNITLPYGAFDLIAQSPYQGLPNQSYYFPLRRAANESQYTLGRAFLQEAYITIDWEAQRFNISQMSWNQSAQSHIVAIPPYEQQYTTGGFSNSGASNSSKNSLSGGAIAGIVIGAVAAIALLIALLVWHLRKRQRGAEKLSEKEEQVDPNAHGRQPTVFHKAELEGSAPFAPLNGIEIDRHGLLSASGSAANGSHSNSTARASPLSPGVMSSLRGYFHSSSNEHSPTTPSGEGTHDSSRTNRSNLISPLSPSEASEADSKPLAVYEMAGDMPTIREKDGKALSEKEAIARREKVYNGVDSEASSNYDVSNPGDRTPKQVSPDDIVIGQALGGDDESTLRGGNSRPTSGELGSPRHRAFSFEMHDDGRELYE